MTEEKANTVAVLGDSVLDGPLYKGPAKCIVVYDADGKPKILHCRISDTVWGTTTNADQDFKDWCKRYDVGEL